MAKFVTVEADSVEQHAMEDMPPSNGGEPVMRSRLDDLTVWQSVRRFRFVGFIAMSAAFCASLDGYRKFAIRWPSQLSGANMARCRNQPKRRYRVQQRVHSTDG